MKKISNFIHKFTSEVLNNMSFVEMHGFNEIIISGCLKIIDYNTTSIICDTLSGPLNIDGEELVIDVFREDVLCVKGIIKGVYINESYVN